MRQASPHLLTKEEIATCLATDNDEIIKEIYNLTLKLYDSEGDRTKSLDSKAGSMIGSVGAFLSAVFVLLNILNGSISFNIPLNFPKTFSLIMLTMLVVILGVAIKYLFDAVGVSRDFKAPGEQDLFKSIHAHHACTSNNSKSAHDYRRFLTEHFWNLYTDCFKVNETKAIALKQGQDYIFYGLITLVANILIIVIVSFYMTTENTNITPATSKEVNSTAPQVKPLAVSSSGINMRESKEVIKPLQASSEGMNKHLSEGKIQPLKTSTEGTMKSNSNDK